MNHVRSHVLFSGIFVVYLAFFLSRLSDKHDATRTTLPIIVAGISSICVTSIILICWERNKICYTLYLLNLLVSNETNVPMQYTDSFLIMMANFLSCLK